MDSDPTPERIMEYEMKWKELCTGGGHMMDFIAIERMYKDVIEYKKRVKNEGPS